MRDAGADIAKKVRCLICRVVGIEIRAGVSIGCTGTDRGIRIKVDGYALCRAIVEQRKCGVVIRRGCVEYARVDLASTG